MTINLSNEKILVTGAAGLGIGAGICQVLTDLGAQLILNDVDQSSLDRVLSKYPNAIGVLGDISSAESVKSMFTEISEKVGAVTGLVNNAAVGLTKCAHEASEEEFDNVFNVNIKGLWLMSRAFVKQLPNKNIKASIVNVSSVNSHATMDGYSIYSSSKGAINALTRGMAVELGKFGIRVNAIAPGYVHAEQNYDLMKDWTSDTKAWVEQCINVYQAKPEEITNVDCGNGVAFLLSDMSLSVTGHVLNIDNGMTAKVCPREPNQGLKTSQGNING